MEQQYEWAVEVTMEYLDGEGAVEEVLVEVRQAITEREARARHDAIKDTIANYSRRSHPRYQRLIGSKLVKRPVGAWETVEA